MLHLGDITKISGYTAPIVDVVVGGSPCQDLSVAGKRAGLDGERSGLFMEQLRIIKEMRERDRQDGKSDVDIRPRYMVWENVPGAFSSNKAEDFRIVLEETAKVKDPQCSIPMPDKGKWTTAGCILGDGWSIAWRVCDAQFWGVPQRRRRIALVADFGGHSAPEILFVRKSVSGNTEPSQPQRKDSSTDASRGIGADDIFCIDGDKLNKKERKGGSGIGYRDGDKQYTLTAKDVHGVAYCFEPGIASREGGHIYEGVSGTIRANAGDNQMATAYTLQDREGKAGGGKGALIAEELSATLRAGFAQTLFQPVQCIDQGGGKSACNVQEGQAPTLTCTHGGEPAVCYSIENHPADSRVDIDENGKVQTLTSRMGTGGGNVPMVLEQKKDTSFIDVEIEVAVRKYPVDCELLCDCLRDHKAASNFSNKDIAEALDVPLTKVEHWFRQDDCFAIPEPDVWFKLKELLGISTNEFDEAITTFEYKGGNYDMRNRIHTGDTSPTLTCGSGSTLHLVPMVMECFSKSKRAQSDTDYETWKESDVANTLNAFDVGDKRTTEAVVTLTGEEVVGTLCARDYKGVGRCDTFDRVICTAVDCRNATEDTVNGALQSNMAHSLNGNNVVRTRYIVRRLTPLECERLQGYPDGWTDIGEWTDSKGKVHKTSDAARYKALGNSIALPPWKWVLKRLCACYERDATLASLFDGIGGFPLIWEQLNGKGSCIWASEIEDFPIAVTKVRIGK